MTSRPTHFRPGERLGAAKLNTVAQQAAEGADASRRQREGLVGSSRQHAEHTAAALGLARAGFAAGGVGALAHGAAPGLPQVSPVVVFDRVITGEGLDDDGYCRQMDVAYSVVILATGAIVDLDYTRLYTGLAPVGAAGTITTRPAEIGSRGVAVPGYGGPIGDTGTDAIGTSTGEIAWGFVLFGHGLVAEPCPDA